MIENIEQKFEEHTYVRLGGVALGFYRFVLYAVTQNTRLKDKDAFFDNQYWVWCESKFLENQEFGTGKKWSLVSIRRAYRTLELAGFIKVARNGKSMFGKGHSQMLWFTIQDCWVENMLERSSFLHPSDKPFIKMFAKWRKESMRPDFRRYAIEP